MKTLLKNTAKSTVAIATLATLGFATVQAAPATYNIDPTHTFANFSYQHMGLSTQISKFGNTKGYVTLDLDNKTGVAEVEIDTTSVQTGFAVFDEHIQAEEFLDTDAHPKATFSATEFVFQGEQPIAVKGDLTIKGITKAVTFEVTHFAQANHPMVNMPAIGVNAYTQIKRSDFNADAYVPVVGDDVIISFSLEAIAGE